MNAVIVTRPIGHQMADLAAEKQGLSWRNQAMQAFFDYACMNEFFTTEDVRGFHPEIENNGDLRAWGAIAQWAKKGGLVEFAGYVPVASSRGGAKTLWRSLIFKGGL
jgi:hypothetical protein